MRKIPEMITDVETIAKLNEFSIQIDEKMKKVKNLKDSSQLVELKALSLEIDALDKNWKNLAGI